MDDRIIDMLKQIQEDIVGMKTDIVEMKSDIVEMKSDIGVLT